MRKLIVGATLALTLMVGGGTALAGEVTGGPNPKPTPINDFNANSICSFSGQNDDPSGGGDPSEAGRVQNWGHTKNFVKDATNEATGGHGAAAITGLMHSFGPGVSCNGHDNPLHGGGGGE